MIIVHMVTHVHIHVRILPIFEGRIEIPILETGYYSHDSGTALQEYSGPSSLIPPTGPCMWPYIADGFKTNLIKAQWNIKWHSATNLCSLTFITRVLLK